MLGKQAKAGSLKCKWKFVVITILKNAFEVTKLPCVQEPLFVTFENEICHLFEKFEVTQNPNLSGFFRGLCSGRWGGGGGCKITLPLCLKLVKIMRETSDFARKYTHMLFQKIYS